MNIAHDGQQHNQSDPIALLLHMTIKNHKDYIFDFFCIFSRFEYTLKACNYYKKKYKISYAVDLFALEPNWTDYTNNNNANFYKFYHENQLFQSAVDDLFKLCPGTQVLNLTKNTIEFYKNSCSIKDLEGTIKLIKNVRNNLFHGGKSSSKGFIEQNDVELLQSATIILKFFVSFEITFKDIFLEGYPYEFIE